MKLSPLYEDYNLPSLQLHRLGSLKVYFRIHFYKSTYSCSGNPWRMIDEGASHHFAGWMFGCSDLRDQLRLRLTLETRKTSMCLVIEKEYLFTGWAYSSVDNMYVLIIRVQLTTLAHTHMPLQAHISKLTFTDKGERPAKWGSRGDCDVREAVKVKKQENPSGELIFLSGVSLFALLNRQIFAVQQ